MPITYGRLGKKRAQNSLALRQASAGSLPPSPADIELPAIDVNTYATPTKADDGNAMKGSEVMSETRAWRSSITTPTRVSRQSSSRVGANINSISQSPTISAVKEKRSASKRKLSVTPNELELPVKRSKPSPKPSPKDKKLPEASRATIPTTPVVHAADDVPSRSLRSGRRRPDVANSKIASRNNKTSPIAPAVAVAATSSHKSAEPPLSPPSPRKPSPASKVNYQLSDIHPTASPPTRKTPRDLSGIFDEAQTPSSSRPLTPDFPLAPFLPDSESISRLVPGPPAKRRMLSRSATLPDSKAFRTPDRKSTSIDSSGFHTAPKKGSPSTVLDSIIPKSTSISNISPSKSSVVSATDSPPRPKLKEPPDTGPATTFPPPRPNVRTYSQARSFLAPLTAPSLDDINDTGRVPKDDVDAETQELQRESYSELRKKYRIDVSSDDEFEDGLSGPLDLKSISELRDKGENRRFMDEMGYLLEGLTSGMSLSIKRLSAMKLLSNMVDIDFVRRAKAADTLGSGWAVLYNSNVDIGDKILDLCLVVYAALATRDPRHADELARQENLPSAFQSLMSWTADVDPFGFDKVQERADEARPLGIGKAERSLIVQLRALVWKADLVSEESFITTRRLLSTSMVALRLRQPTLLDPLLTSSLIPDLHAFSMRVDSYVIGLPMLPSPAYDAPDLVHVDNCLRSIEGMLLDDGDGGELRGKLEDKRSELVNGLISMCIVCQAAGKNPDVEPDSTKCLISALRLLVNIADSSELWSTTIFQNSFSFTTLLRIVSTYKASPSPLEAQDVGSPHAEHEANKLDIMCLALALLTGIVQEARQANDAIFETKISSSCEMSRSCVRGCRCSSRKSAVDCIVELYLDQVERSNDLGNAEASFLKGHLAVFLGLLCDGGNVRNHKTIMRHLPGATIDEKLDGWSETIKEFVGFYADLTQRFAKALQDARITHDADDDEDVPMGSEDENFSTEQQQLPSELLSGEVLGREKGIGLANKAMHILDTFRETTHQ